MRHSPVPTFQMQMLLSEPRANFLKYKRLGYFVCRLVVSQLHNTAVGFTFHFKNHTDQGNQTEGLEREGSEGEGSKRKRLEREGVRRLFAL
jgi:hypothetical protein